MIKLEKLLTPFKAVLFDLDGTMLNSEPLHSKALLELLKNSKKYDVESLQKEFVGLSDDDVFYKIKDQEELYLDFDSFKQKKEEVFKNLLEEISDLDSYINPGLFSVLSLIKEKGIPLGLVSASHRGIGQMLLDKFDLNSHFPLKVFREDTFLTKPDPSPYLKASRDLRVNPTEILIFEDSKVGLTAALGSGATVYQLTTFNLVIPDVENTTRIKNFLELLNPQQA